LGGDIFFNIPQGYGNDIFVGIFRLLGSQQAVTGSPGNNQKNQENPQETTTDNLPALTKTSSQHSDDKGKWRNLSGGCGTAAIGFGRLTIKGTSINCNLGPAQADNAINPYG